MVIEFNGYDEKTIIEMVVNGIRRDILSQKKYWGEIPPEGHYSDFDKFKNQIANLVAEKLYKDMINNDEVSKRIEIACSKAEENIIARFNKNISKSK